MENTLNLRASVHPYLVQFTHAQLNLAKVLEEERKQRSKTKQPQQQKGNNHE